MILILSIDNELSTDHVIKLATFYNKTFDRINEDRRLTAEIKIDNEGKQLCVISEKYYDLQSYQSYWYRRGDFHLNIKHLNGDSEIIKNINENNKECNFDIQDYIHHFLHGNIKSINGFHDNNINKLCELDIAQKVGLNIPHTLITSSKLSVQRFIDTHKEIIVKSIKNSLHFTINDISFSQPTLILEKKVVDSFPDYFMPIKLQKYIEKAFELRVFFLAGSFYASAIFSQNDEQTKIDFRNYNFTNPNRVVPYNLPKTIKVKLNKFMKELKLVSGSFDLVVTKAGEYFFLEVNPIGQFSQVSIPCNYYLEKQIARYL
jgi:ATP-GRASP peptide maturase of grasp-with-spasm system